MVLGLSSFMILVPCVYQCADMDNITSGFGILSAIALQALVYSLSSMAFIGDPWPTNKTGIFVIVHLIPFLAQSFTLDFCTLCATWPESIR